MRHSRHCLLRIYLTNVLLRLYECLISPVLSIGMGISVAISLSSLLGFPWTPMHPALPLLCLGIGIDDMFVIMQVSRSRSLSL